MNKKDLLLNAIEEMLNGNIDKTNAICENLEVLTAHHRVGYRSVKILGKTWEYHSGEEGYPVSGEFVWDKINWSNPEMRWTEEQLELRMSLLEHIKFEVLKLSNEEFEEMFKWIVLNFEKNWKKTCLKLEFTILTKLIS